jgi:hypothetical protein
VPRCASGLEQTVDLNVRSVVCGANKGHTPAVIEHLQAAVGLQQTLVNSNGLVGNVAKAVGRVLAVGLEILHVVPQQHATALEQKITAWHLCPHGLAQGRDQENYLVLAALDCALHLKEVAALHKGGKVCGA